MRRVLLALLASGLLLSCQDGQLPSDPDLPKAGEAISDGTGTIGEVGDDPDLAGNEHFFWLPPLVTQPDESVLGTFTPDAAPTVRIVCLEDSDGCPVDPEVASFTVGSGVVVETDHYKVDFDTGGLETSTSESDFTTYRIEVLTPPLGQFGGPFVIGFADFQLGENGKDARNLDTDEALGLTDGRTLPIRFRLDEGVLAEELSVNTAPVDDATGAAAFCQINCTVQVLEVDEENEVSLSDPDTGDELTAILIPANTIWTTQTTQDEGAVVYVIDERVDDGDAEAGGPCLTSGDMRTEACFRHELSPDNPNGDDFTADVRAGVCPEGQAVANGAILPTWRFLKADQVNGDVVITRPLEVDVSDFLACDVSTTVTLWDGPGGELAGSALRWLVSPLRASDFWGGQLRDLSDLFWGEDVEMTRLAFPSSAEDGTTLQMTVQLTAVHDGSNPSGRQVTFERTGGSSLSAATNHPFVSSTQDSIATVATDGNGQATVNWTIGEGANRLEVSSSEARPAPGEPHPVAFEVTGDPAPAFVLAGISAGNRHTCGAVPGDTIYCWGQNPFGQLGDGTTSGQTTPSLISMGSLSLSAVSVHGDIQDGMNDQAHSCAVDGMGDVYCWGYNDAGELGTATNETCTAGNITSSCSTTPVAVDPPAPSAVFSGAYADVTTGVLHSCALDTGGTVLCWGLNAGGALGDSTNTSRSTPNDIAFASDGTDLRSSTVAVTAGENHTCTLTSGGEAYCWGLNSRGQLGDGTTTNRNHPVPVNTNLTFAAISAGNLHTCGITTGGDTYCWGENSSGQLGDGTTTDRITPVQVANSPSFDAISGGGSHTCGLTGSGELYCWGGNSTGQLGTGTQGSSASPVAVADPAGGSVGWQLVEAGELHTCALSTAGGPYCWGRNDDGQLGDGTTTAAMIPVPVAQPAAVIQ